MYQGGPLHVRQAVGTHRKPIARRYAAVLFVDLTGFTALVDSVQPEAVYERVTPILDELVLLVTEYGGAIQQVLGDGFMAVFGIGARPEDPDDIVAHSVLAGMELVRAAGELPGGLPVHVGIECGEVLVSTSWEPARFAVWGRAVTVAARLCDLAGPDTLHIGPQAAERGGRRILQGWQGGTLAVRRARLKGISADVTLHGATWHRACAA
jgi:class 3 adenylate cyclase